MACSNEVQQQMLKIHKQLEAFNEQQAIQREERARFKAKTNEICTRMKALVMELAILARQEEDELLQLDVGVEQHAAVDAPQVFDKSPRPNTYDKLDEGNGDSQEDAQEDFEAVPSAQCDGLNPSKGWLAKFTSGIHDKLAPNAQQKQHLLKEMNQQPKKPLHSPFIWDWQWVLGPKSEGTKAGWSFISADNYGGKEAKSFCLITFDPGGILLPPKWLLPDFHTIHNLEAGGVDPGKLMSLVLNLMYGWLVAFTLAVVRLVFDPGGEFPAIAAESLKLEVKLLKRGRQLIQNKSFIKHHVPCA